MPSDLLLLAALLLFGNALYTTFVKPSYLLAVGWLVSSILLYLRSRQLSPISKPLYRIAFWVVSMGIVTMLWLLSVR